MQQSGSLRELHASQGIKQQPSFQVSPIQMAPTANRGDYIADPSASMSTAIKNTETERKPGQMMYN